MTKRTITSVIQLVVGVGLVGFLLSRIPNRSQMIDSLRLAAKHWPLLLTAYLCFAVSLLACVQRWRLLLNAVGLSVGLWRAIELYLIGHFFNSFLPGAVSGDFIKAFYVVRHVPAMKTEAAATVFVDRIVGMVGLVILAVSVMLARLPFFLAYPQTRAAAVYTMAFLILAAGLLLFIFQRNTLEKWSLVRRIEEHTSIGKHALRAYRAFNVCLRSPRTLAATLVLSVINHVMYIVSIWLLGMAMDIPLTFLGYLTLFPVINSVAAIPLTPGGLGTRDSAAVFLLGTQGVADATTLALSLTSYSIILAWSLVGGIVYAFHRSSDDSPPPAPPTSQLMQ